MIKTPKDHIKILIEKYENHVEFCNKKFNKAKEHKNLKFTAALWNEEKTTYEKVLIDLYKLLNYEETDTDLEEFPKRELKQYRDNRN